MKNLKMLGLGVLAAATLMAFTAVGTASATVICKTNTSPCSEKYPAGTEIKASLSGTSTMTTTEGTVLDTCSGGSLTGSTKTSGSANETVGGPVTAANLTWTNCTEPTVTLKGGETETHSLSGTSNGTYTASGFEVTINTTIFGSCLFSVEAGRDIGTVTGGAPAVVDINAVITRKSGLCPSTVKWVGTYKVTSPTPLYVKES